MTSANALKNKDATISVVVPNYNHAHVLPHAIETLLAQDTPPQEIILIDDASTDNSPTLVLELARKHAVIRPILRTQNKGTVAGMNEGLGLANCQYVFFAASDDWTEPHLFTAAIKALEEHPEAALFCGEISLETRTGKRLGFRPIARPSRTARYFSPPDVKELLQRIDQFIVTSSAVFRREHLISAGGFDPELRSMADTHTARRLALMHGFYFAPIIAGTLCVDQNSLSRSTAHDPTTTLALLKHARSTIESEPIYPPAYGELFERRWRFAISRLAVSETSQWLDFVLKIGARNSLDRFIFCVADQIPGKLGASIALAWLTLRLKPYATAEIFKTAVQRWRENRGPSAKK